jgi:hypothetical protein
MGAEENGSKEHLSIDVDMDGGINVEMNTLFYPQQETWSWWTLMKVLMTPS